MKKLSLEYCAGIIDGDGTITLTKVSKLAKWRAPVVSVSSTTPIILQRMQDSWGGCICRQISYKSHHRQSFSWRCEYQRAIDLCREILPFLLVPEKIYRSEMLAEKYLAVTLRNGRYSEKQKEAKHQFEYDFFHPSVPLV